MSGRGKIMTKSELKDTLSIVIDDLDDDNKITVWNILFEDDRIYSMNDFDAIFYDYTPLDMMDIIQDYFCSSDDYFWYNSDGEITIRFVEDAFGKIIIYDHTEE